ncbi:Anoctamin-3, partial [Orchesella cincta]
NIVAVMILILCWIIPDMPGKLRDKIQREQRLVHDLIIKQELKRTRQTRAQINEDIPIHIPDPSEI